MPWKLGTKSLFRGVRSFRPGWIAYSPVSVLLKDHARDATGWRWSRNSATGSSAMQISIFFLDEKTAGNKDRLRDVGHRFAHVHAGFFNQGIGLFLGKLSPLHQETLGPLDQFA